jgi:threonyl-tRNA synthetase
MVHRAILGSVERFIGVLTEHHAGDFPLWLAPEQVRVLSVSRDQHEYARDVAARLRDRGLRAEADERDEKIGFKIREASMEKVPYILVVGDKEVEQNMVAVRERGGKDLGAMPLDEFMNRVTDIIAGKSMTTELTRG